MAKDMVALGRELFGSGPEAPRTRAMSAMAASDSRDGTVDLYIGGERMPVACLTSVAEGDDVVVTLMGRRPVVLGAKGWGDGVVADIEQAKDAIEQAEAEADAARKEIAKVEGDLNAAIDKANGIIDDIRDEIETVSNVMEAEYAKKEIEAQLRSEISQSAAEVKSQVALQYATKGEQAELASKVEQTATGIRSEVSAVVTDVAGVKSAVSRVEQTATGIQASIDLMADGIEDAKKYATNYLSWTASGGVVIGNQTSSTLGGNVQVTSTGVNIRDGETVNASFTASRVSLLGGRGSVFVGADTSNVVKGLMTMEGANGTQMYYARPNEEHAPYGVVELVPARAEGHEAVSLFAAAGDDRGRATLALKGPACGGTGASSAQVWANDVLIHSDAGRVAFGSVLYSNASGTTGTVQLSGDAGAYSLVRIYYGDASHRCASLDLHLPHNNLATCYLAGGSDASGAYWWYVGQWLVAGSTMTPRFNRTWNHMTAGSTASGEVKIYRVEGWFL